MISGTDFISQIDHRAVRNNCIARETATVFDPVIHVGHLIVTSAQGTVGINFKSVLTVACLSLVTGIDAAGVVSVYGLDIFVRHPAEQALELRIKLELT